MPFVCARVFYFLGTERRGEGLVVGCEHDMIRQLAQKEVTLIKTILPEHSYKKVFDLIGKLKIYWSSLELKGSRILNQDS